MLPGWIRKRGVLRDKKKMNSFQEAAGLSKGFLGQITGAACNNMELTVQSFKEFTLYSPRLSDLKIQSVDLNC